MPNITNIPAPRAPLVDPRTGIIADVWFRWFINIFMLTGGGTTDTTLVDVQIAPSLETMLNLAGEDALAELGALPVTPADTAGPQALQDVGTLPPEQDFGPLLSALQALSVGPVASGGSLTQIDTGAGLTGGPITSSGTIATSGAITATGFTVTTDRLLGRDTAGTGAIEELTIAATLSLTGGAVGLNLANANTWTARQTFNRANTTPTTFAGLPATPAQGDRGLITDASATTFASVAAGGGANIVPVYYDGANWLIG